MPEIHAVFYGNPDRYPPIINGSRILTKNGFRILLTCRETMETINIHYPSAMSVERVDSRANKTWQEFVKFLVQIIKKNHQTADIFIGHDMHGFLAARLLAWRYRKPLIYHCHEYIDWSMSKRANWGGRLVFLFQVRFAKTADLIVVPDAERADLMINKFKLVQAPLVVTNSPMGIATASGKRLHEELAKRGKKFEFIIFRQGSIGPSHAIETTLQSMPNWAGQNWGFVIMGPGAPGYICHLEQMASDLGVAERFVVLPPVSYDEVLTFTGGADVGHSFYSPVDANNRFSTTASNKLMEYMAAGLPLLVSNRPGLRDLVSRYACGVVADESDPQSIAQAVNWLLADPAQARQMGANGRRAFSEVFAYEKQFAPVLAWLQARGIH